MRGQIIDNQEGNHHFNLDKKDFIMKKFLLFIFTISSSYAFELSIDTLNTGETKELYSNSGIDTVRFDSARVDLIKSGNNQYHLGLVSYFTDNATSEPTRNNKGFYFYNYGEFHMGDNNVNNFQLQLELDETISLEVEGFDYQVYGIIPESGPAPLEPPQPMQAKMVFYTNKGSDSIIINGMQTNQPRTNAIVNRKLHVRRPAAGRTAHFTINGKLINIPSLKDISRTGGVVISSGKNPDGSTVFRKSLTRSLQFTRDH